MAQQTPTAQHLQTLEAQYPPPAWARQLAMADYAYPLPEERIAQRPLAERDAAQLLVYDGAHTDAPIRLSQFAHLPAELPADALLVMNDTRVMPARLLFQRATGARIEVFCLAPAAGQSVETGMAAAGQTTWTCMVGNARKWRYGEALVLRTANPQAELTARLLNAADGRYEVQFRWTPAAWPFSQVLEHFGATPLPPYLRRPAEAADRARYQTVYAQAEGAVAAPTAGLHFTERLLQQLAARGIATERLTLHVGAGTFRPVTSEDPAGHPMHAEEFSLAPAALRRLAAHAGPLVAVGTTSLRLLESAYWLGVRALREEQLPQAYVPQWLPYHQPAPLPGMAEAYTALAEAIEAAGLERLYGATQLMILPGYPFATARGLITNFHLPRSTLLLLIAAFVGHDWKRLYETALANNFRFLSYGDGSLLWRPARLV